MEARMSAQHEAQHVAETRYRVGRESQLPQYWSAQVRYDQALQVTSTLRSLPSRLTESYNRRFTANILTMLDYEGVQKEVYIEPLAVQLGV